MTRRRIVIITGISGSGKSTAANTLEDLGYFCVDNIPVDLLPKLLELVDSVKREISRLALVIDLRQIEFFEHYAAVLASLESSGAQVHILFLDARDDVIVRRYSETRRQHPLALQGNVPDGIRRERDILFEIRDRSDWVLDTSNMTVHQLRREVTRIVGADEEDSVSLVVGSFGFSKGLPAAADLVFDVRFLPNPHFVDHLRHKDGRDPEVAQWLHSHPVTGKFLHKLQELLEFLLPLYIQEGKRYLTISAGCTGGRHRSVVVAEALAQTLREQGYAFVEVKHRELAPDEAGSTKNPPQDMSLG